MTKLQPLLIGLWFGTWCSWSGVAFSSKIVAISGRPQASRALFKERQKFTPGFAHSPPLFIRGGEQAEEDQEAAGKTAPVVIEESVEEVQGEDVGTEEVAEAGQSDVEVTAEEASAGSETEEEPTAVETTEAVDEVEKEGAATAGKSMGLLGPVVSAFDAFGKTYSNHLTERPIATKSLTASIIFGLSDWTAQKIENSGKKTKGKSSEDKEEQIDWMRIAAASLVGLLYFGPASHAWYETIFKILPGTSLVSTLQKATLGQLLFGPSFTCIFFASALLQTGDFSLSNWFDKIKSDLPAAWAAGLGFWPLVDLVSYSLIPSKWIPLFVNICSFIWTIYLSIVSNSRNRRASSST